MAQNLLQNSSFEGDGHGEWVRAHHSGNQYGNWFTPISWTGWHDERAARPEAHVIPFEPPFVGPPARVYDGHYAIKMHKSFEPWMGGHYQIVSGLEPGQYYEAGFMAHAWCNQDGLPHAGNANCAPVGCGPIWRLETALPPLNGNAVNDAWWAALFQAGVQFLGPTNRPDPTYNVFWGPAAAIYNAYQRTAPFTFEAQTERVCLFLRAALRWGFRNNDAYIDSAFLRLSAEPAERSYERTYVLYWPGASINEQLRIAEENPGVTIGPSADDAALDHRFLEKTTIVCYRPQKWGGKDALEDFWQTYYEFPDETAGDEIIYREDYEPPPPNFNLLWQRDPRWSGRRFGDASCGATIGDAGCFITCLAMAQRFYGIDVNATPVTIDSALGADGYDGCMAAWRLNNSYYERALEIGISDGSTYSIIEHLQVGGCAMAEIAPGPPQHFVLAVEADIETSSIKVLDPWPPEERWMRAADVESWRLLRVAEPSGQDMATRVGLHVQGWIPGILENDGYLAAARPQAIKRVEGIQDLVTVKQKYPWITCVYRDHAEQHNYLERGDPQGNITQSALEAASDWIDICRDSLYQVSSTGLWTPEDPLYLEAWNELGWCPNMDSVWRAVSIERAFVVKVMELGLPVRPLCFNAGVGNIGRPGTEEQDFLALADLAKETAAVNGAFGLHSYWTPYKLAEGWKYLAGRYQWIDQVLERDAGVRGLKWILTEGGIAGCQDNPNPLEHAGWRAECGYNGNWTAYKADILEANWRYQDWNSTHGNRLVATLLFTVGQGVGWHTFLLDTPQIQSLAGAFT